MTIEFGSGLAGGGASGVAAAGHMAPEFGKESHLGIMRFRTRLHLQPLTMYSGLLTAPQAAARSTRLPIQLSSGDP